MSLHFNWKHLNNRLTVKTEKFRRLGDTTDTPDGPMIFIDNKASILAVAHLDTVAPKKESKPVISKTSRGGCLVNSIALDDRLGVCILLDILPKLGLKYDVLLTDSEEVGKSTAGYFPETNKYNWIFEFDRAGTDVVMYDYGTNEYEGELEQAGFRVGRGSFTDICYLEHLGVAGYNFGCGYHAQHTDNCWADLRDAELMIWKFAEFYDEHASKYKPWEPSHAGTHLSWKSGKSVWDEATGRYVQKKSKPWQPKNQSYRGHWDSEPGVYQYQYQSDWGQRNLPAKYKEASKAKAMQDSEKKIEKYEKELEQINSEGGKNDLLSTDDTVVLDESVLEADNGLWIPDTNGDEEAMRKYWQEYERDYR